MFVIVATLLFGSALMTSCVKDQGLDEPEIILEPFFELGSPDVPTALMAYVPVTTTDLLSISYTVDIVDKGAEFPEPPVLAAFVSRDGKKLAGRLDEVRGVYNYPDPITLSGDDGLDRGKRVRVHVVAETIVDRKRVFYNDGEIFTVEFETPDEYPSEEVLILRTHSEGADILVQIPERIRQENRRIKWGISNYAMIEYYGQAPVPEKLHSNDTYYPATLIKNDTILRINHHNAYRRTKDGEIGYYYYNGNNADGTTRLGVCGPDDPRVQTNEAAYIQYYQEFQPGAPLVLMMSEVAYTDCKDIFRLDGEAYLEHLTGDCDKKHPMIDWGWGPGYYWYPYDYIAYQNSADDNRLPDMMPGVGGGNSNNANFDQFWHEGAWWQRIEFRLPGPAEFTTGGVDIKLSNRRSDGCTLTFTPTGDTYTYFISLCPATSEIGAGYQDLLRYVNGEEDLLQWLTTSEVGWELGIRPYQGITVMNIEDVLPEIRPNMVYHVIVNAVPSKMVDGDLTLDVSKQKFYHEKFTLPEYTLDEPELEVTVVETKSPYKVKFNVKNPKFSELPVKKVVWAANYTRDFAVYMSTNKYTYADMVLMNNGVTNLEASELKKVNSKAGLNMEFDVRENSSFTLAVMGWNNEGRTSNPDKNGSKAVAEAHSIPAPDAEALDMEKLNALKGDWTATATIKNTSSTTASQKSWKVTIGDLNANKTLTAEEYTLLESLGVKKAAADAYLAEFNKQSADYNAAVKGQNRVLCQGWDLSGTRETSTVSPWDLFLMEDYKAAKVDYLFYDFGPKWFLQTDAKGNIFVPVNNKTVQPMMLWFNGMEHYLCSGNLEKGIANWINPNAPLDVQSVGIPVEISEDGNTITLKSRVVNTKVNGKTEDVTLYPTVLYDNQGNLAYYTTYVVSEVVLTRGWTEPSVTPAIAKTSHKNNTTKYVANSEGFESHAKPYSRTLFIPQVKSNNNTTVVTKKFPTKEEIREGLDKLARRLGHMPRK